VVEIGDETTTSPAPDAAATPAPDAAATPAPDAAKSKESALGPVVSH
jgi:hypothetical protein